MILIPNTASTIATMISPAFRGEQPSLTLCGKSTQAVLSTVIATISHEERWLLQ
ncbi:hypothetical protein DPMN_141858 [Dreissena polymorpha]|uniref:Uncharacterized protein n=1 Tax=Dreissena polymorpha TaxID=45954 RepID=A0A9D4GAS7_DREPO|nr:hypothetical protein DPMN_141858 [Dreissena polymorpha]